MDFAGGILDKSELIEENREEICLPNSELSEICMKIIRTFGGSKTSNIIQNCMDELSQGKQLKMTFNHDEKSCRIEFSSGKKTQWTTHTWH